MRGIKRWYTALAAVAVLTAGCVTGPPPTPQTWEAASGPAWSYNALPKDLAVDVSPAGDTMRWGGSVGNVVGRGVDLAQNATYRNRFNDALGDYNSALLLETELAQRISEAVGPDLRRVAWLSSTAGHASRQSAEDAYYGQLARSGVDILLEVQSRHGVFGADAAVATALRANLFTLPGRQRLWREVIVVSPGPAYAFAELGNPTRTSGIIPRRDLRFGVDSARIDALTADRAALLRAELEETREGAIAALLVSMGLSEDPHGHYTLGRTAMASRDYDDAIERFERALALQPDWPNAHNGLAVAHAYNGDVDGAIAMAEAVVQARPDFAPAHANLAWWYAKEKGDAAAARRHLESAPEDSDIRAILESAIEAAGNR